MFILIMDIIFYLLIAMFFFALGYNLANQKE